MSSENIQNTDQKSELVEKWTPLQLDLVIYTNGSKMNSGSRIEINSEDLKLKLSEKLTINKFTYLKKNSA